MGAVLHAALRVTRERGRERGRERERRRDCVVAQGGRARLLQMVGNTEDVLERPRLDLIKRLVACALQLQLPAVDTLRAKEARTDRRCVAGCVSGCARAGRWCGWAGECGMPAGSRGASRRVRAPP